VDEGAARIAGVDGRVRLDVVLVVIGAEPGALQSADDPGGHRVRQAERIADRHDEIAHRQPGGIAQPDLPEAVRIDLYHRDVGLRIYSDDPAFEIAAVLEGDGDAGRVFPHVGS